MLNYPIIFELQADYLLEKFLDNGKYRTEKWRFVPFVSILTTCLCAKHKATLPDISPFIILIKTYIREQKIGLKKNFFSNLGEFFLKPPVA